jgi:hypothetical protein
MGSRVRQRFLSSRTCAKACTAPKKLRTSSELQLPVLEFQDTYDQHSQCIWTYVSFKQAPLKLSLSYVSPSIRFHWYSFALAATLQQGSINHTCIHCKSPYQTLGQPYNMRRRRKYHQANGSRRICNSVTTPPGPNVPMFPLPPAIQSRVAPGYARMTVLKNVSCKDVKGFPSFRSY